MPGRDPVAIGKALKDMTPNRTVTGQNLRIVNWTMTSLHNYATRPKSHRPKGIKEKENDRTSIGGVSGLCISCCSVYWFTVSRCTLIEGMFNSAIWHTKQARGAEPPRKLLRVRPEAFDTRSSLRLSFLFGPDVLWLAVLSLLLLSKNVPACFCFYEYEYVSASRFTVVASHCTALHRPFQRPQLVQESKSYTVVELLAAAFFCCSRRNCV